MLLWIQWILLVKHHQCGCDINLIYHFPSVRPKSYYGNSRQRRLFIVLFCFSLRTIEVILTTLNLIRFCYIILVLFMFYYCIYNNSINLHNSNWKLCMWNYRKNYKSKSNTFEPFFWFFFQLFLPVFKRFWNENIQRHCGGRT